MVPELRPLLAAADARVRRVNVDDGANEGNMLTRRDADGWEYRHLHINNDTPGTDDGANPLDHAFAPGIDVGALVTAGQVVAFAGDSGNAEGTRRPPPLRDPPARRHSRQPLSQPAHRPGLPPRRPLRLRHQPAPGPRP